MKTAITRTNQIKKHNPKLYFSLIEADRWIDYKLLRSLETEETETYCSNSHSPFPIQKQLQERLFLLGENANRRAMRARNKGNMPSWLIWDTIVTLIDFVGEWLDRDRTNRSYTIY